MLSQCCSAVQLRKAQKTCPVALRPGEKQASSNLCSQLSSGTQGSEGPRGERLCYKTPFHERDRVIPQLQTGLVCLNSFVNTVEPQVRAGLGVGGEAQWYKEAGVLCESSLANRQEAGKGCPGKPEA